MNEEINTIVCLLMIFLLSMFTLLLLHIGRHTKSNIYLAIYFLSQIIGILTFLFKPSAQLLFMLGQSVCYTWGTLFYLFISSLLNSEFKFRTTTLLHFIPSFLVFILFISHSNNVLAEYDYLPFKWIYKNLHSILTFLFSCLILVYNLGTIYKYHNYLIKDKHLKRDSNKKSNSIWMKVSVFGFAISCLISQLGNIPVFQYINWFFIGNAAFLIYFSILLYVAIVNRTITDKLVEVEKYKNSSLSTSLSSEIIKQVEMYMQQQKAYINPELNLRNLSSTLNIQEKYISEVINKHRNMNFSEFINSFRVSYAMELLMNPENRDKTMLYILFESGFNSKTTFNTSFKKIAGCTPLEFKNKFKKQV